MNWNMYLVAQETIRDDGPLPAPVVVATISTDKRFIGTIDPHKALTILAARMGLLDFEIVSAEALDLPGHQLGLPFPPTQRRRYKTDYSPR